VKQLIDILESIRDSISSVTPHIIETTKNTRPEPYTLTSISLSWWNLIVAIIAAISGCMGAFWGYYGYRYSKLTADNVARISDNTQIAIIDGFVTDLWRNIIYTLSITKGMVKSKYKNYPSERILSSLNWRLPDSDDIFKIEKYGSHKEVYLLIRKIKAQIGKYEDDIEILKKDFKNPFENRQIMKDNLKSILARPLYLIGNVGKICSKIETKDYYNNILRIIISSHFNLLDMKMIEISQWGKDYEYINFCDGVKDEIYSEFSEVLKGMLHGRIETFSSRNIINNNNEYLYDKLREQWLSGENSFYEWLKPIFEKTKVGEHYKTALFDTDNDNQLKQEWKLEDILPVMFCIDTAIVSKQIVMYEQIILKQ
jgi:hypothetical protein